MDARVQEARKGRILEDLMDATTEIMNTAMERLQDEAGMTPKEADKVVTDWMNGTGEFQDNKFVYGEFDENGEEI